MRAMIYGTVSRLGEVSPSGMVPADDEGRKVNNDARIIEPGQIEAPAGHIPFLRLAGRDVFSNRAERFRQLSRRHSLGGYLSFLGTLAQAQQEALNHFPSVPLPTGEQQARCRKHGMPVLCAQTWPRDPAWRIALKEILWYLAVASHPRPAGDAIARLMQANNTALEGIANKVLAGEFFAVPAQDMPFVAAALQVYWTSIANALGEHAVGRTEQGGLCPVCGSLPVTSIVRKNGAEKGLRYLSCSLCATEWHMVRIKCSSCESTRGLNYYHLEGSNGAVKAESCDDCNSYLKLLSMEKDHKVEAVADDMATLVLDMLMNEEGKVRSGPNLLLHPGSP